MRRSGTSHINATNTYTPNAIQGLDIEVAVLLRSHPAVPVSLAEFEAWYEESRKDQANIRVAFAIEVEGEVIRESGLHHIDHFNRNCELGIGIGASIGGKASERTRSARWSTTRSNT
jgi:hypothetical protein